MLDFFLFFFFLQRFSSSRNVSIDDRVRYMGLDFVKSTYRTMRISVTKSTLSNVPHTYYSYYLCLTECFLRCGTGTPTSTKNIQETAFCRRSARSGIWDEAGNGDLESIVCLDLGLGLLIVPEWIWVRRLIVILMGSWFRNCYFAQSTWSHFRF